MHTDTDAGVQYDQQERWGQCSLRYPPTAKLRLNPWYHVQGGVVESKQRFGEHGPWHSSSDRDPLRCISVDSVKSLFMHVECVSELSVIVLLSLHGSGAGIVPRRVVGFNSFRRRRSVPVKRVRRETSAESWSVRSSSMNCVRGLSTKNSSRNLG